MELCAEPDAQTPLTPDTKSAKIEHPCNNGLRFMGDCLAERSIVIYSSHEGPGVPKNGSEGAVELDLLGDPAVPEADTRERAEVGILEPFQGLDGEFEVLGHGRGLAIVVGAVTALLRHLPVGVGSVEGPVGDLPVFR